MPIKLSTSVLVATLASMSLSIASAQVESGLPSQPRSTNERVNKAEGVLPPVNSDYRKAAEGTLPAALGQIPVPREGNGVPNGAAAIDPAARAPLPQAGVPLRAISPGLDTAMLVEHALGMSIEASALQTIAEQPTAAGSPTDFARMLLDHSRHMMKESQGIMTNVNADGPATSKARPFIQAANNYMTTLAALSSPASSGEPIDKAQLTLVNHAVKGALDAGHIRQFGHAYAATPAIDQLMSHARAMQDKGTQTVLKLASKDPVDTKAPATVANLARYGLDLLEAADRLAEVSMPSAAMAPRPASSTEASTRLPR